MPKEELELFDIRTMLKLDGRRDEPRWRKDDEWRFHDKDSDTSLWDNASKLNKMDIELDGDNEIELSAILRGDVDSSYDAAVHNRAPEAAPIPNAAPLPLNNDDELLIINPDIV